ncbi:DUF2815 family protein [Psychrobacillus psychrodurans]|uniref:DUF2815 family protein n=1 Tax=Psychrobacillus psychrodurans TaxID=126157 RepID=UPI001F4E1935|nr:DUF2815 family protein [Psychrobacillus psychrodurans]MCK1996825.1 DUF2815 family protein [Psychrobacillus psychrodurans]
MAAVNTNATTKVITGKVRASYVHIFKPHSIDGNDPKYSMSIIIPKSDTKTLKAIKAAIEAAKQAGIATLGGKIPANLKTPLRDGDIEREDDEAYADSYFINCSSKQQPGVIDQHKQEIMDSTEVYSGCYVRASINFYAFAVSGNKGIAAGLNNVQKWADGDFLGGRSRAEDEFDELEIEEEGESYLD